MHFSQIFILTSERAQPAVYIAERGPEATNTNSHKSRESGVDLNDIYV